MPSVLGFAPVLAAPLVAIGLAVACRLAVAGMILFWRPILDWLTKSEVGFLGRAIRWVARPLANSVRRFEAYYEGHLWRAFNGTVEPLVRMLNTLTVLTQMTYQTIGDLSLETWRAIEVVRTQTIPREINRVLAPIRTTIGNHTRRLDTLERLNQQVASRIGDALRALPWGVAGTYVGNFDRLLDSYVHTYTQVFRHIAPRLTELANVVVPEVVRDVARVTARVAVLEAQNVAELWARVQALEALVPERLQERLDALGAAIDDLASIVTGTVVEGLPRLYERMTELEARVAEIAGTAAATLAQRVSELEARMDALVGTAVETLAERVTQLETELRAAIETATTTLAQRIAVLEAQMREFVTTETAALATRVTQLEAQMRELIGSAVGTLAARVTELETAVQTRLRLDIDGLLGRIQAIETQIRTEILPELDRLSAILAPAAFAALVLATMQKVAPNLFCRNVTNTSRRICAQDEGLWESLLAGTLVLAIALNPREIARAGTALTGILGGVIAETVDH